MHEAEIARLVLDNVQTKKGFNRWRILENDNLPYLWTLLSAIDKDPKQAVGVYDIYKKNPKNFKFSLIADSVILLCMGSIPLEA